ncbi:UNVERIFIED_CONTAM: hypothetical protein FKN15_006617 [Acipenser sinensis]
MDATQLAEMLDLLRQTLTAVAQGSAGPAGPDPQLMPTKMTAEDRPEAYLEGEFSHLVLLAAFDCIDDTKLVKQLIISEIISSLPIILNNKYGKKVLLYLLNPRDPAHFLPEIIKVLQQGDGNAYSISLLFIIYKKDVHTRQHELLEAISPPVLQHLQENAREVVMDKATSVVVTDILGAAVGDLQPAMDSVADLAAEEFIPGGKEGELCLYFPSPVEQEEELSFGADGKALGSGFPPRNRSR